VGDRRIGFPGCIDEALGVILVVQASHTIRKLLAKRFRGALTAGDYVDWALSELLAGVDTPNLRILAGLSKPPYWPEVDFYFQKTLADLGWSLPEPEAYLREYVLDLARAILAGEVPPAVACHEMYEIWRARNYPASLQCWNLLGEGLDPNTLEEFDDARWDLAVRREALRLLQNPDPLA
jgi:hypothetical protein